MKSYSIAKIKFIKDIPQCGIKKFDTMDIPIFMEDWDPDCMDEVSGLLSNPVFHKLEKLAGPGVNVDYPHMFYCMWDDTAFNKDFDEYKEQWGPKGIDDYSLDPHDKQCATFNTFINHGSVYNKRNKTIDHSHCDFITDETFVCLNVAELYKAWDDYDEEHEDDWDETKDENELNKERDRKDRENDDEFDHDFDDYYSDPSDAPDPIFENTKTIYEIVSSWYHKNINTREELYDIVRDILEGDPYDELKCDFEDAHNITDFLTKDQEAELDVMFGNLCNQVIDRMLENKVKFDETWDNDGFIDGITDIACKMIIANDVRGSTYTIYL